MSDLIVKNLSMRYDLLNGKSIEALRDVSFHLRMGELLTVLGPSGCGKTTMLNIIAGLLSPTGGDLYMGDDASGTRQDASSTIHGPSPRRGLVFQQGALFEWLTVGQNIGFGPSVQHLPRAEINKRVAHLLESMGLQGMENKAVYELSGGMQQRVALARCLAADPELILMDEPLGALDALTREKMQSLVLKLWNETGKTVILITHSVEEALLLGQRLFVMAPRPGRIACEYNLDFARQGVSGDLRKIKSSSKFTQIRDEILSMIWDMEEQIMGGHNEEN